MAGTWGSSHPPVDTLLGVCVSGTPAAQARCGLGKGRRALCAPGGRGPTVLTEGPVRMGHVPKIACPSPARAGGACTWGPLVSHRPRGRGTEEATARRATGSGEKWGAAHGGAPQARPHQQCLQAQRAGQDSVHPTWSGEAEAGARPGTGCGFIRGQGARTGQPSGQGQLCVKGADTAWGTAGPAGRRGDGHKPEWGWRAPPLGG